MGINSKLLIAKINFLGQVAVFMKH